MRVAAFDLSLTCTGVAKHVTEDHMVATDTITPGGLRDEARLCTIRDAVLSHLRPIGTFDLAVLEGYSYGTRTPVAHSLGELGGVVKAYLWEAGVEVVVVPPSSMKKYATGKGNAKKDEVLAAAVHRSGLLLSSNDEADAWWLLQMASARYGLAHVGMPEKHREALDGVAWPTREGAPDGD